MLRKDEVEADHFRVWAVVPVLAIGSCLLLLWQQDARVWGIAGLLLLGGVVLYAVTRLVDRRPRVAEGARRG